jgi:hypothetical protein
MAEKDQKTAVDDEAAWSRFERAVDVVAKSPPQHKSKPKPPSEKKRGTEAPRPR